MERFRTVQQLKRRAACDWIASPWALRLWMPTLYLVFFYVWFLCIFWLFGTPRNPAYNAFWTESENGHVSLLSIVTAINVAWATISIIEIIQCCCIRTERFRIQRVISHSFVLLLFVSYVFIVRKAALASVNMGP